MNNNKSEVKWNDSKNIMNKPVPLNMVLMVATNNEPSNLLYLVSTNIPALMSMVTIKAAIANAMYLGWRKNVSNCK